jgi:hypothetical protein
VYSIIFSIKPEELEGNVHKMKMKEIGHNLLHRHLQKGKCQGGMTELLTDSNPEARVRGVPAVVDVMRHGMSGMNTLML